MTAFSTPLRLALVCLAAVLALGLVLWHVLTPASQAAEAPRAKAVPVTVTQVERRDVQHSVTGIGTVQSLHSVTLRPQVSGILTEVLFREGQFVKRGDVLARIDDRGIKAALAQAQAEKARNQALLKSAELDLTRYGNLVAQEAISRQTLEQQAAQVEQLEATVRANAATVAAQEVQLSYTVITAPVSGRVGIRRVDPGNLVQAGDANGLVTVTQIDPISIVFTLPQNLLPRVRPVLQKAHAAKTSAEVSAYDRDAGDLLAQGKLTMIDNQIDVATGTIRLRAEFSNEQGQLWPGQFVTVRLATGTSADASVVPVRTVQQGMSGPYVYRVRDSKAEVVPVTVAYQDDERVVIGAGLDPGDTVVVDGQSRLKPGISVQATELAPPAVAGAPTNPTPAGRRSFR